MSSKKTSQGQNEEESSTDSDTLPMVPISPSQPNNQNAIKRSAPNSVSRQTQNQSYCCNIC